MGDVFSYPVPLREHARLAELVSYAILDTAPEAVFEQLVRLAATVLDAPMAMLGFLDADRQWFKASVGTNLTQVGRNQTLCAHTILGCAPLIVRDVGTDPRFAHMTLAPGLADVRFYAAIPLLTPRKLAIGTLCILDRVPRAISKQQVHTLQLLALQAGHGLEARRAQEMLRRQTALLNKAEHTAKIGGWELHLRSGTLLWTDETFRIHGVAPGAYQPEVDSAIEWYTPATRPFIRAALGTLVETGTPFDLELQIVASNGSTRWIRTTGQRESIDSDRVFGIFQDLTDQRLLETEMMRIAQREQSLIGSTLHDGLGQELTGVSFMLHSLETKLADAGTQVRADLAQLKDLVRDAIGTCRSLAHGLAPTDRDRGGLIVALQSLCSRMALVFGVRIDFRAKGQDWAFDCFVAEHVYRIAQEALNNAIKYASPQRVSVAINIAESTSISVSDDGAGIPGKAFTEGMGLQIIRYRAQLIGATISIDANASGGTRVRCRVPPAFEASAARQKKH
jgi:signal transduction histidine kinase